MKVLDYLKGLKAGDVIKDKRALLALRRAGLIWDYSKWGYLESILVYCRNRKGDGECLHLTVFPEGNAAELEKLPGAVLDAYRQGRCQSPEHYEDLREKFTGWRKITYKGMQFETEFYSGCFSPFLVKC